MPDANPLDRFVYFAFAAAELLAELTEDGRVSFAAGAFRTHLGREAEALRGERVHSLVAAEDHALLDATLAVMGTRGRCPPVAVRLADPARTPFSLSGLAVDGTAGERHLYVTLTQLPAPVTAGRPVLQHAATFARDAEARLRAASPGAVAERLSLLQMAGPAAPGMDDALVVALGPGASAARLGEGRYGLLTPGDAPLDLRALSDEIGRSLGLPVAPALHAGTLELESAGLSLPQAVRALRFALSRFAGGDPPPAGGLPAVVAEIGTRAGALRQAIRARHFDLRFQPIVEIETRRLHHLEALLRPLDRTGLRPGDLVTLAEAVGLTAELDMAVAAKAVGAAQASAWPIAMNLSGLSVQDPAFRQGLLALVDGAGRAHDKLVVELTETAEISDEAEAAQTLEALRARGIPTCIDDFGAGAAAFRYLKAFPVDYVKLDGTYVRAAAGNARDRGFIASMVDVARVVGAAVVAEHIETEEDAALMASLGIRYGQGWLFGRPGPLPA